MSQNAVTVENLFKTYGQGSAGVHALRGVNLTVAKGEIFGLLGRNGAGKTTLVKILLDIVRPTGGHTLLLDLPSNKPSARQHIGYLPEDHRFPEYRTAEGVLHYYAMLSGVGPAQRRERIPELLKLTGLADAARRKVRGYSKGMKQRLGLAQALVHDPQVLFLDEPTDGVDPVGRAQIREFLIRLKGEGKTIFLNSHLLGEVEQLCDRVAVMEKGQIVRIGSVEELTRGGEIYAVSTQPRIDEALRAEVAKLSLSATLTETGCDIEIKNAADIDRVIDLLRSRNISIRGLTLKRMTLEEVFLQSVDYDKKVMQ